MFKKILIICAILILLPTAIFAGNYVREKGEWGEWWGLGYKSSSQRTSVKRIYDQENKLVCWIVIYGDFRGGTGIDCEPSLELGHPLTY